MNPTIFFILNMEFSVSVGLHGLVVENPSEGFRGRKGIGKWEQG